MMKLRITGRRLGLISCAIILGGAALLTATAATAAAPKIQNTAAAPAQSRVEKKHNLPGGFVYLDEVIPKAQYEIRYYSENNFTGTRVDGYKAPLAIFSRTAANALKKVSDDLDGKGYILRIYDAYRPQKAVNHFVRWSQDAADIKMKQQYYPKLDKRNLFKLGFISKKSGHSRGSTIDLTLADKKRGRWLTWAARMISSVRFLTIILLWSTVPSMPTVKFLRMPCRSRASSPIPRNGGISH